LTINLRATCGRVAQKFHAIGSSGASLRATSTTVTAIPLTTLDATYTENFNTLANGPALSTKSAVLPAGWGFDESGTSARNDGLYEVNAGGDNTGDIYSYGALGNTDRAFGTLRSGALVPIIVASFTNNTGAPIRTLDVSYAGEQWRLGAWGGTDQLDFQIGVSATSLASSAYVDVDSLDFSSPFTTTAGAVNGNAAANRTALTVTQYGQATTFVEPPPSGATALLNDRPPLVLEASILNPPYEPYPVTVIVNHLRSLSGVDGSDGRRIRTKRRLQAEYLAQLIRSFQDQNTCVPGVYSR
jgi:hypothetical protein